MHTYVAVHKMEASGIDGSIFKCHRRGRQHGQHELKRVRLASYLVVSYAALLLCCDNFLSSLIACHFTNRAFLCSSNWGSVSSGFFSHRSRSLISPSRSRRMDSMMDFISPRLTAEAALIRETAEDDDTQEDPPEPSIVRHDS